MVLKGDANMKKYIHSNIPNSEDWRTDTDSPMINAFREIMADSDQYQDDAYVGIFWYDTDKDELFGVVSTLAEDVPYYKSNLFGAPVRTSKALHYKVWQREYFHGKDARFQGDYTMVPRGRIFQIQDYGFVVCVGKWINEYPQAKKEILYTFQLPEDTEFRIDSHWDLGHGWSDKDM